MRIEEDVKLDFCDVLIKPKRSKASSRSEIVLERKFNTPVPLSSYGVPVMVSNMDSVGSMEMARKLSQLDMWTCLHKHYSEEQLIKFYNEEPPSVTQRTFYTMGISEEDFKKFINVYNKTTNIHFLNIDVANGYQENFVNKVKSIRDRFPNKCIMAGNVATPDMVQELIISAGVNIVKVGIGPGSVCITRLKSGVGYPQLSAIMECADAAHGLNAYICSDGGCIHPGDVAKAIAAGADFVMLGGMFAGTDECEGEWEIDKWGDKKTLTFYGMSSKEAMEKYNGGLAEYRSAEGKAVTVPYKGSAVDTARDILGGLRSACSYVGASSLKDLSKCTTFVKVNRLVNNSFS